MDSSKENVVGRWLLLAPVIFVGHFLEEAPGFVGWFNAHVERDITPGLFWRVNLSALAITVIVVSVEWVGRSAFSLGLVVLWISFLMLANAVLHVVGCIVDGGYVPGLFTAILLYVPYSSWILIRAARSGRLKVAVIIALAVVGSIPMLVHGYLIVFRGSRLF